MGQALQQWPGRLRRRTWLGVLALLVAVGWLLASSGTALVVDARVSHPDAIISLASHEWERLPLTAELAAAHGGALVLLTLPQPITRSNCHDCLNRVNRLRRLGISERRVRVLPIVGPGTYGEALTALAFARQAGIRSLLVATSAYHTRRSLAVFRRVFRGTGVEIGVAPALRSSPAEPQWWWLSGYDRAYVAYEWAAIIYYRWKYDVPVV